MTEEDFLKRWSRRKREVAEAEKLAAPTIETSAIAKAGEDNVAAQDGSGQPNRHGSQVGFIVQREQYDAGHQ